MKKKIFNVIAYLLIFSGITTAFIIGEQFNSEQFKLRNVQQEVICTYIDMGEEEGNIAFFFECAQIVKISGDNFEVKASRATIKYPRERVTECLTRLPLIRCWREEIRPIVLRDIRAHVAEVREDIVRMQRRARARNSQFNQLINFTTDEINF